MGAWIIELKSSDRIREGQSSFLPVTLVVWEAGTERVAAEGTGGSPAVEGFEGVSGEGTEDATGWDAEDAEILKQY